MTVTRSDHIYKCIYRITKCPFGRIPLMGSGPFVYMCNIILYTLYRHIRVYNIVYSIGNRTVGQVLRPGNEIKIKTSTLLYVKKKTITIKYKVIYNLNAKGLKTPGAFKNIFSRVKYHKNSSYFNVIVDPFSLFIRVWDIKYCVLLP